MAAPDVDYVTIYGWLGGLVGDTAGDPDKDPDWMPVTGGKCTLTPTQAAVHAADANGITVAAAPFPIPCTFDSQGRLSFNDDPSVTVVDLGSEKVNPRVPRDQAAYIVSFDSVKSGEQSVKMQPFGINPSAADADSSGNVNLFDLQPLKATA